MHHPALTQDLNGTANDVTFGYAYNPAGEIASNTRSNDAYSYVLANANVTSTANGLNQLTAQGGANVTYDARGNVDVIGSVAYAYYAENRMWVTTALSGGYLYYDPAGRLSFIYDPADPAYIVVRQNSGNELVQERAYNGAIRRRYVFGAGTDEPLVWYEGTGLTDRRWLHADERGSVIAASDGSGNLVGSINRYDDYGGPQGGSITGRFGYTGQAWIPEIGMYDYRARFYNPALGGRFMQSDPIGFGGGMNVYAYVGNNPVNRTDPLGLADDVTVTANCPAGTRETSNGGCTQNNLDLLGNLTDLIMGLGAIAAGDDTGGEQHVFVTGERPKRLSSCMRAFLTSQGFGAANLADITFIQGMRETIVTRTAEANGYGAVVRGNTIYVRSSRWADITDPMAGPTYFEEIIHTMQSHYYGSRSFDGMNFLAGVMGWLATGNAHDNHIEMQAIGFARMLHDRYRSIRYDRRCPD